MRRSTNTALPHDAVPTGTDERALFEAIFRNAAIGIALVDMQGRPVESNAALERMLGYSSDELRAMSFTEFTHPDDVEADWDLFQELIVGKRDHYEMHKRYLHRDGRIVSARLTVSLIRGADGTPHHAVGMVEDVSEHLRLEERYRTLVEQLPGVVYTAEFGESGRWDYASPYTMTLLGFMPDELRSDPLLWWRQIHPEDRGRVIAEERRVRAEGGSLASEYRMLTRSGDTVWVYDVASVVWSDDGRPFMHGVILDITRQKEIEQRLSQSEGALRTIIDSEPECVKQVGRDGTLLAINPAGVAMIEAGSTDDVIGACVYDIVAPEHREAFRRLTESTFAGDSGSLGFDIIGLRGTRRSMETHAVPLRDHSGEIVASLAITRDVTDRKRAETELHDALDRAEQLATSLSELNRAKSELIQLLSHELFTPISVIQGVALTLANGAGEIDPGQRRDLAAGVERASHRLRRLVGNLSAAARLDREGARLETTATSVEELISRATQEFAEAGSRLHRSADAQVLHTDVAVDQDLAMRAIAVVIENALDMSDDVVEISASRTNGSVTVTVADHGPGVPAEARESIFDAFVQVDGGMTREHEGLGVGLYLARRIMQAHGGHVRTVTRPGYGGVFELSFPVATEAPAPADS
jgi:PAS domain S-box-containing protein